MPECPVCRTPYEEGLRLCQSCGASLLSLELRPALCPRCGARVSTEQEYCQECHWPLAIEPSERLRGAFPEPPRFTLVSLVKHLWFHGFLAGLGVAGRYLEALPVKAPRRSGPAKKKPGLPRPEKKGEPLPEPEAM